MKTALYGLAAAALVSTAAVSTSQAALVQAFEFNTPGDTEGFVGVNANGVTTTAGGLLVGTAATTDPQVVNGTTTITATPGSTLTTAVARIRQLDTTGSPMTYDPTGTLLIVGPPATNLGQGTRVADGTTGFTFVTWDLSAVSFTTPNTITSIRLDPVGGTVGEGFQVDYLRISDSSPIPEPASLGLLGLGGVALLRRRR